MVGRLLLAARGNELACGQELPAVGGVLRHACKALHAGAQVERGGIHRVIHAWVRDKAVHVQGLGDAHRARRREADRGGGSLERGRVEGCRRLGREAPPLDVADRGCAGILDAGVRGVCHCLVLEAGRRVRGPEALLLVLHPLGSQHAREYPVVLGHERLALTLALDDEGQRGRLHATCRADVAKAAEAGHREVAREHGAPDEVNVLATFSRVGKILVKLDEVRKGMVYLGLRKGRVARTRDGGIGRDLEHLAQGVRADELALTIEVRADDDGVSLLGQVLEGTNDALLGGELLDGGPDQVGKTWDLPALDVDAVGEKGLALAVIGGLR